MGSCRSDFSIEKLEIVVPNWRIIEVAGKSVIIIRRFDRINGQRVPFLSAMSMLGATDHSDDHSYLGHCRCTKAVWFPNLKKILIQLWRRNCI